MLIAGLFAGIGGFELGFRRAGHRTILLCENDKHASQVLARKFPTVTRVCDVGDVHELPLDTDVITAGFPCQNLSKAGNKAGIHGEKSRIVNALFKLLDRRLAPWVVIENVYFMLYLMGGKGIESLIVQLEDRCYRWAYRVVDSRAFGLPQRRRRVFLVPSQSSDPRNVLLADDAPNRVWANARSHSNNWILLDGGPFRQGSHGGRDSPDEGWLWLEHSMSASCVASVRSSGYSSNRSR